MRVENGIVGRADVVVNVFQNQNIISARRGILTARFRPSGWGQSRALFLTGLWLDQSGSENIYIMSSSFRRSFSVPQNVEVDKVEMEHRDGKIVIRFPKIGAVI